MPKLPLSVRQFLRRHKPPRALWRLGAFLVLKGMNAWFSTLNLRMARYDATADPAERDHYGPAIYILWHEYIPLPVFARPNCRLALLLSQHQDAEILSNLTELAGFETVRGSTSRGGTAALRELIERGKGMSLAITPDGPRGPRRRLAQGCVYLSSRLQIPIIPIAIGHDRPWRNRSAWDQFAIPRPFARCRAILGPRIQVPANLSREEIESSRKWIENQFNQLTEMAEQWAESKIEIESTRLCRSPAAPSHGKIATPTAAPEQTESAPVVRPLRAAG